MRAEKRGTMKSASTHSTFENPPSSLSRKRSPKMWNSMMR